MYCSGAHVGETLFSAVNVVLMNEEGTKQHFGESITSQGAYISPNRMSFCVFLPQSDLCSPVAVTVHHQPFGQANWKRQFFLSAPTFASFKLLALSVITSRART
jgi:hypothetical protein